MFLVSAIVFFNVFLSGLMVLLSLYLVKKKIMTREKSSPFECGFDPKNSARIPFSMRFFLVTVIFLVFDIEIVLLLPYLFSSGASVSVFSLLSGVSVILVLMVGTFHEWSEGSLEWFISS
uniref:NADH-ubiquinone oxidoreductase chain 3 n=1 Tax=Acanthochitona avicula TaxID=1503212 RepID=A0A6H1PH38_9MOLL|nr:NADH dehydrogenase subunit 3 [Acanthochitona avicula]QIZ12682.1 NADH dehydrogenase subunit 3 [Acanthochitona avicula]